MNFSLHLKIALDDDIFAFVDFGFDSPFPVKSSGDDFEIVSPIVPFTGSEKRKIDVAVIVVHGAAAAVSTGEGNA